MKINKKTIKNAFLLFCTLIFTACNESFLDLVPETVITEKAFWMDTQDLETYLNQFYVYFPGYGGYDRGQYYEDINSDNLINSDYDRRLAGHLVTPSTGSSLDYSHIREINYFLEKGEALEVSDVQEKEKNALLGEGYFFRAYFYFNLLVKYGDLPWIDKVLTTESPELYSARSNRALIVDNILSDLDLAIEYLKPAVDATPFRLNKEISLVFKSRVSLFEGTWEKYHNGTPFGVSDQNAEKYLKLAEESAETIINGTYSSNYTIYSTGNPNKDYFDLFNQTDLQNNNEIIFWRKYDVNLKVAHNSQRIFGIYTPGVSKSLVDSYLCVNGNPISNSDGLYEGDDLPYTVFKNRDPRLSQLVFVKGDPITIVNKDTISKFDIGTIHLSGDNYCPTGYNLKKGFSPLNNDHSQTVDYTSTTAAIIFRYAEVLLNYAEAKAELGTLTQADVDLTINKLRDRVSMPHLNIDNIVADPNWDFPYLSAVINEIRRERRCELACEGFRLNDLLRWRAYHLITDVVPLGIKFNQNNYPSLTPGVNVYLSDAGYVEPYGKVLVGGWKFKPERDYLLPLTLEELNINKNLVQNPGWNN